MRYEESLHLGIQMPLIINQDTVSLLHGKCTQQEFKKGEVVYFETFVRYEHEKNLQYFWAKTTSGARVYLTQNVVDLPKANFYTITKELQKKHFTHHSQIEKGMKVLALDDEVSEVGSGVIVEVIDITETFPDGSATVLVRNEWDGEDTIGLLSLAPTEGISSNMTKKKAIELAILALRESEKESKEKAIELLEEMRELL